MLDVNLIRKNSEEIKKGVATKNVDSKVVDDFLAIDTQWRELTVKSEEKKALLNKLSKERNIEEAKKVKLDFKKLEDELKSIEDERLKKLRLIPNLPLPDVPIAKDESGNVVLREVGTKRDFSKEEFTPKNYLALTEELGIIDTKRAAKVSGTRFGYFLGAAAQLEFALIQFVINTVTNQKIIKELIDKNNLTLSATPFIPVIPPVLVGRTAMAAMGYMDRGIEEIYHLPEDDLFLVGTSEQSIGPMHMDEVFDAEDLPRRYLGFSTCFRREAGSHGKDTKGILRVHQFDKLEMFSFVKPEDSAAEHKLLLAIEEYLMQQLELPYHVLHICSADLGDPAAAKYDIEAWMPGQNESRGQYRETHSTSNTTDYQARRLNVRFRQKDNSLGFVHTLNGTAFAIGRALIAIFENYQQKDGSIATPKALQQYTSFSQIEKSPR